MILSHCGPLVFHQVGLQGLLGGGGVVMVRKIVAAMVQKIDVGCVDAVRRTDISIPHM